MQVTSRTNEGMLFLMSLSTAWFIVAAILHGGSPPGLLRPAAIYCVVIAHFYITKRQRTGTHFFTNLVFPSLGAAICVAIWLSLSPGAKTAGFTWLAAGLLYLAFLTKGFSQTVGETEF